MTSPLEERREQWLVEQLAGAWEWTEEMVRNALDKDCPRLNALSIDEERVARALYRVFEEREPPTEYQLQGQWLLAARAAIQSIVGEGR